MVRHPNGVVIHLFGNHLHGHIATRAPSAPCAGVLLDECAVLGQYQEQFHVALRHRRGLVGLSVCHCRGQREFVLALLVYGGQFDGCRCRCTVEVAGDDCGELNCSLAALSGIFVGVAHTVERGETQVPYLDCYLRRVADLCRDAFRQTDGCSVVLQFLATEDE